VEVGCNSVLFPGTIVERNVVIYPLCPVRGYIQSGSTLKNDGKVYPRS
jgi:UDP-N-acetylglucosamine diphosphorylase / glucose-1-phosphate thymidylyltransferase / UDP-N-acetylgalactosamine diphosphorylase / glucosamine-1-phosphate N-acetyltransferase / galactosamine-1-phosphate N-acetyltransferase